jgi:hypothetical protein
MMIYMNRATQTKATKESKMKKAAKQLEQELVERRLAEVKRKKAAGWYWDPKFSKYMPPMNPTSQG